MPYRPTCKSWSRQAGAWGRSLPLAALIYNLKFQDFFLNPILTVVYIRFAETKRQISHNLFGRKEQTLLEASNNFITTYQNLNQKE